MDDFAGSNGNGPVEDGASEDKRVKFAVFAAGIGAGRKVAEKRFVELPAGKARGEDFRINANGDGAETLGVEFANQFASVALPDGKEGGHADAREIFFAVGAEVFEENVAKGDFANALIVEDAQGVFHARFIDGVDALRRDADFVQSKPVDSALLLQKLAP